MAAVVGSKLDFTKGRWPELGVSVVTEIQYGRVQNTYSLKCVEGKNVNRSFKLKIRLGHDLFANCKLVGTATKVTEAVRKEKQERSRAQYNAAQEAQRFIQPGDIISIRGSKNVSYWEMKVTEIDHAKGRIYGVRADISAYQVAGKRAWVSLTSDLDIMIKAKNAFDPATDEAVRAQTERAAVAANKRAITRARRAAFRDVMGY